MAVDFFVDILDGAHGAVADTGDHRPAVVFGGGFADAAAGGEVAQILLVDVGGCIGVSLPLAHHLFREVRGNIQVDGQIGAGESQLVVFKFVEPVQEFRLLFLGLLAGLVDGVGGGLAVGHDQSAVLIPLSPNFFIGCVAVYGEKGGGGIGIHIGGVGSEFAA